MNKIIAPSTASPPVNAPRIFSPSISLIGMQATYTRTPAASVSLMRKKPPAVCRAAGPKVSANNW